MISRLVTVDSILTMSEQLRRMLTRQNLDLKKRYDLSVSMLDTWAKKIEAKGLSVSLNTIMDNAFRRRPDSLSNLESVGDHLIDDATEIEWHLSGNRFVQSAKSSVPLVLENAAKSGDLIPFGKAAAQIVCLENSTDAAPILQQYFRGLLPWENPGDSPEYHKLLTAGANGGRPKIPKLLVLSLEFQYARDKDGIRFEEQKEYFMQLQKEIDALVKKGS
jgi:hypothetical protein